jgi:hypothetical protein
MQRSSPKTSISYHRILWPVSEIAAAILGTWMASPGQLLSSVPTLVQHPGGKVLRSMLPAVIPSQSRTYATRLYTPRPTYFQSYTARSHFSASPPVQ